MKCGFRMAFCNFIFVLLCLILLSGPAHALPFNVNDARTLAMGGVGVATGTHNAVFNNPALLTAVDEIHEWFLILPAVVQQQYDPDDLKGDLDSFKQAANALDVTNNATNRNAVQASLNNLNGSEYHESNNFSVSLAIPSRILSGAVYLNSYDNYSIRPIIGGDDLLIPSYSSRLAHRGFRVIENGVSAAKILNANKGWTANMAIGFSAEFLLVETYNYETGLRSAEIDIDSGQGKTGSQFGVDVGLLKEFGVWKFALVAKNLVPGKYEFTSSNDDLKIDPQLRAGFAYQSRQTVMETNIDIIKNQSVGFESETQILAFGWEYRPRSSIAMRAGINHNMVGTKAFSFSAGFGFNFSGIHIDMAGSIGNEGHGLAGQFGFQF